MTITTVSEYQKRQKVIWIS